MKRLYRFSLYKLSLGIFVTGAMTVSFQNCGDISLTESISSNLGSSTLDISGSLCLDPGFTLTNFFITNLSMKPNGNDLSADTDIDGLSDYFEIKQGFDPNVARSQGPVLDGVCFYLTETNNCQNLNTQCEEKEHPWGLSDCDIYALNLQSHSSSQLGIDSDNDGIPDKIELVFDLNPAVNDALLDYDNDNINNITEVLHMTHPRQSHSYIPQVEEPIVARITSSQEKECEDEEWTFTAKNQKIYHLRSQDSSNSNTQELLPNHFLIVALLERVQTSSDVEEKSMYIYLKKKPMQEYESLIFSSEDFQEVDNEFFK